MKKRNVSAVELMYCLQIAPIRNETSNCRWEIEENQVTIRIDITDCRPVVQDYLRRIGKQNGVCYFIDSTPARGREREFFNFICKN